MDFYVLRHEEVVGQMNKEWFSLGDSYKVEILDEEMEAVVIAIVVAIDCVKADQAAAASGGA